MKGHTTNDIFQELDRTYKTVFDFMHEVQDALEDDPELDLYRVCEADEVYVVAGEKGTKQASPRERGLKKGRGTFKSDKPPVMILVCRSDGRVRFLVCENLEDVDEEIVEYSDEDDPAILCTDQYTIYDGIDEYDEIDGHLVINHNKRHVIGDAHTNSCGNRHSFLRNWLRRFRGVSKHHLQGYLNFLSLTLNTDRWFERILSTDFYR